MKHDKSHALFSRAVELIPGGVNSPVRAFKSVGGEPFFVERADGAYLHDVDGNRYIDYVGSWGPMILGHGHPAVVGAVTEAAAQGWIVTFGARPDRAETGYGYIQRETPAQGSVYKVARFVEKPDLSTAQSYLQSGDYLWNAGIFVFRARDMLDAIARHLPELSAALARLTGALASPPDAKEAAVREFFASCPSLSIDYGVMEKEQGLSVVPGDFGWSDLGSWQSAWELSPQDEQGNVGPPDTIYVDARGNLVDDLSSGAPKTIALVGVSDLCVVETDDELSYWALAHPPGRPDFHHPDCFALAVAAPDGA